VVGLQAAFAEQMTGVPWQTPLRHWSLVVQASPSLHAVWSGWSA
jgi:hypothetical protein